MFIDCNDQAVKIADYVSFGPNNELYLANNQTIAFMVNAGANVADVQLGIKAANGNTVTYEINGDSHTVKTTTDMYYSILKYAEAGTVTIKNVSGGILSLTNIKVTHTSDPGAESGISLLSMDGESVGTVLKMLRKAPAEEEGDPKPTDPEESTPTKPTDPEESKPEKPAKPDNSELKKAVDAAKKLKAADYTEASFKALDNARKAAEKVLKNKKSTQAQIDKALADLNQAMEELVAKPDTTALKKAVDAAKKLKSKDYTKASFKALDNARKAAEKVLKDKNATQAQVDKALADLNAAVEGLEAAGSTKPGGASSGLEVLTSVLKTLSKLLQGSKR